MPTQQTKLHNTEYISTICYNFNCIHAQRPFSFYDWNTTQLEKGVYFFHKSCIGFSSIKALQNSHLITSKSSLYLVSTHIHEILCQYGQVLKHQGSESKFMSYISFGRYWLQESNFHHCGLSWTNVNFKKSRLTK